MFEVKIERDEYPESPREWDNLGTMVYKHSRYILGDVELDEEAEEYASDWYEAAGLHVFLNEDGYIELFNDYDGLEYLTDEEFEAAVEWGHENAVILPLYIYDHSGVTMRTHPFASRWDSGQVGFIYVSNKRAIKEYGKENWRERAEACLKAEVETYDQYLRGDVWCYTITDADGEIVDSCCGFYGSDYAEAEAENIQQWYKAKAEKEYTEAWIEANADALTCDGLY